MTDQQKVREAFEAYWSEHSWNVERIDNPSGYVEYKNHDLHHIWMGWQAALAHASSASAEECSVVGADAITLMRFIFLHFGDVSMSHHLTDEVVAAVRRIEAIAGRRGDGNG